MKNLATAVSRHLGSLGFYWEVWDGIVSVAISGVGEITAGNGIGIGD